MRWIVGGGNHGCWLGSYERPEVGAFLARVAPGMTIWDIGAHAGYFTLASARRVGRGGRVVAIEPLPGNFSFLQRNVEANGLANVTTVNAAVCDRHGGQAGFDDAHSSYGGRLSADGRIVVNTVSIDGALGDGLPQPDVVKMDVEGAEGSALAGAAGLLAARRTQWMIALHGHAAADAVFGALAAHGYRTVSLDGRELDRDGVRLAHTVWGLPG